MVRRLALVAALAAIAGGLAFYLLTVPQALPRDVLAAMPEGDAARGELVFWAGGCASCHAAEKAEGDDRLKLGGGLVLASDFGDFVAPNISMHEEHGIGAWTAEDFANALARGVSPEGRHYYPSFPWTSYARMEMADIADLWAFMRTLPAVENDPGPHRLGFPFNIRRGVGMWKLLHAGSEPVVALDTDDPKVLRGQYLVEGPGHCGECHTPRDFTGGLKKDLWLAGASNPDGPGRVPNITPGGTIADWSEADIAYYLESGFTPEFDSVGGSMVEVQENMAALPASDREAIAAYLKAIPAVPSSQ
ncbi:cytochrome c [Oricola thermophila]|uniref:Cytochrome c n=1 Tax=Oricola thermophila TaxID=2742145 RepID=A0A6N1VD95_9HYPH|nr:cytochrome c [Oricola thermophila]QKV18688.1 cytochrome c [Oricola thermophila]